MKTTLLFLLGFTLVLVYGCKDKPTVVDKRNRTLVNIPLAELKNILAGNWLLVKDYDCGVVGCTSTNIPFGQQDTYSFLQQDSVRQTKPNGNVVVYDKAIISKTNIDNLWLYDMYGGLVSWAFLEIKNDTLILNKAGQGSQSYLVKKL